MGSINILKLYTPLSLKRQELNSTECRESNPGLLGEKSECLSSAASEQLSFTSCSLVLRRITLGHLMTTVIILSAALKYSTTLVLRNRCWLKTLHSIKHSGKAFNNNTAQKLCLNLQVQMLLLSTNS